MTFISSFIMVRNSRVERGNLITHLPCPFLPFPLGRFSFSQNEKVLSIEFVMLETGQSSSRKKPYIVVGTAIVAGEETAVSGNVSSCLYNVMCSSSSRLPHLTLMDHPHYADLCVCGH